MPAELPLQTRIDLAEAFIELAWTQIKELPPSRGGTIADHRWQTEHEAHMLRIDAMLDAMLPMYDQRALEDADAG